jgi:hypothetical protein
MRQKVTAAFAVAAFATSVAGCTSSPKASNTTSQPSSPGPAASSTVLREAAVGALTRVPPGDTRLVDHGTWNAAELFTATPHLNRSATYSIEIACAGTGTVTFDWHTVQAHAGADSEVKCGGRRLSMTYRGDDLIDFGGKPNPPVTGVAAWQILLVGPN